MLRMNQYFLIPNMTSEFGYFPKNMNFSTASKAILGCKYRVLIGWNGSQNALINPE